VGRAGPLLFVHNSADLYGASQAMLRVLRELFAAGERPIVVLPERGPLEEKLAAIPIERVFDSSLSVITRRAVSPLRLPLLVLRLPVSVLRLRRLIRRRSVRLVHTNSGVIFSPALAARLAGVPHIWHVRESFREFGALWKPYSKYVTRFSHRVVAISRAVAEQFPEATNVVVIYDGIRIPWSGSEADEARGHFRELYGLASTDLVVGCVGRIKFGRKGQEHLVRAASILERRGVRAKYLMVGTTSPGSEEHLPRLHRLIASEGVGDNFVFTGDLADPWPAYAAMDVLVLPSAQQEPFGLVVTEAMASARPVVATSPGGAAEQVVDGETGYLVPLGDELALVDRLATLLSDAALRQAMGLRGLARVREQFSLGTTVACLQTLYREAAGEAAADDEVPLPRAREGSS